MKKLFVYLAFPVALFSIQACNSNSASNTSTTNDSTTNASVNDSGLQQNADSMNTDTSEKKKANKIDASEVPSAVMTAFNSKYPNVSKIKWLQANKKGKTVYRARWEENGKKMMAAFAEDGSLIKEKEMN